ncbi:MAG: antitoxin [Candidatus Limnocylindria bacterium]
MPRTTIDIDAGVLRELKTRAHRDRRSIGQLASELLADALHSSRPAGDRRIQWISRPMNALVDIEDKEAVRRALEER